MPIGDVHAAITEFILKCLVRGIVPWRMPWRRVGGLPLDLVTGREYRGINVFLLSASDYESRSWLMSEQVGELGAHVREGEEPWPVVTWSWTNQREQKIDKNGELVVERRAVLEQGHVFNAEQCAGLEEHIPEERDCERADAVRSVGRLMAGMSDPPELQHSGSRAYYCPPTDTVVLPGNARFPSEQGKRTAIPPFSLPRYVVE